MDQQIILFQYKQSEIIQSHLSILSIIIYNKSIIIISYNQYSMFPEKMEGMKINNYSFLKKIGSGNFAVVYEAINLRDDTTVAIKTIPRKLLKINPKIEELVGTEIRVMRAIAQKGNDNVVRFVDRFMSQKSLFIVIEYCNGGNLQEELTKKKFFSEEKATEYLKQILNGFRGMHEANAMHRDFKLSNLLLHQGECKIADLGFAIQLGKGCFAGTICGTSQTMAPEVLDQKPYGMQADIWSLGVVYYQMIFGQYPYYDEKITSDYQMLQLIKKTKISYSTRKISDNARNFMERCLTIEPNKRISWSQIYQHPLIKNQNKMIYGLSALRVTDMKNFYKAGFKLYQNDSHKKEDNISFMDVQKISEINPNEVKKITQINEQKKQEDKAIKSYQDSYLKYRNNIMFIFKYVTPYIQSLQFIVANHDISLFITSKKAYQDMASLSRAIEQGKNLLNLKPYFNQFVKSRNYKELTDRIKSDAQLIRSQVHCYQQGITHCNDQIRQQFDPDTIKNANWSDFVYEQTRSYQLQLSGGTDDLKGTAMFKDLINVIESLNYYRNHLSDIDVEDFENKITSINYKESEKIIEERLQDSLKFND